ncbi:MAG: redoxin domain-containing protein [Parafilimonas sp.]
MLYFVDDMIKRNCLFCLSLMLCFIMCSYVQAQQKSIPKTFPVFSMKLTDGSTFKSTSIKKGNAAMVIYFSPTCDHCQDFISDILKNMQDFKRYKIILITYVDISEVKKFEEDYHLKNYKNIIAGTEGTDFIVRFFYNVTTFPFTALYNKNLNLVSMYRQPPAIDKLKKI